jgi:hypothetical protein
LFFDGFNYVRDDSYVYVDDSGVNMLTNEVNKNFTITELEVWEVINVENLVLKPTIINNEPPKKFIHELIDRVNIFKE